MKLFICFFLWATSFALGETPGISFTFDVISTEVSVGEQIHLKGYFYNSTNDKIDLTGEVANVLDFITLSSEK